MCFAIYFHEHASYAVKAMERGIAVLSETAAGGTMQECVELVEAAQRTGVKYMLSENYPYMRGVQELRRLYTGGTFGKVMYAEGGHVLIRFQTKRGGRFPRENAIGEDLCPLHIILLIRLVR